MRSRSTAAFWRSFRQLPPPVQAQARAKYRLWRSDPSHPSLRFKLVHPTEPIWSVRVSRDYRALGLRDADGVVWFWIGSNADYDRLLSRS